MSTAIDHLKKVTLELQYDDRTEPFEFIFGIASEGLCPFEYLLLHKVAGDQVQLMIPQMEAPRMFAHLYMPLRMAMALYDPPDTIGLAVSVTAVTDAQPREVVRAMAQATEKEGCGGNCGCGCSGH